MSGPRLLGRARVAVLGAAIMLPAIAAATGATTITAAAAGNTRLISSSGTVFMSGRGAGSDTLQRPEIRSMPGEASGGASTSGSVAGAAIQSSRLSDSNSSLVTGFDGLNHRQQRLANGGDQFSLEPPDQGLCVGNGNVMEIINDVTRVYDTAGNPKTGVIDLNTFFGYPAAVDRDVVGPGRFGPFVTDPSCLFDPVTQHWFADVLTLDVNSATGAFLGPNHLDIAVSKTSDPTGAWTIFRLPVQDDGTAGTPDHGCSGGGAPGAPTGHGPCLGDYPHLGSNNAGIYITTNEYSFFGPEFHGAQVYAFAKSGLIGGAVAVNQFDTHGIALGQGQNGFTLWPSTSPNGVGAKSAGGTEYFLSSNAAGEATDNGNGIEIPHPSQQLLVWALTNTGSLDTVPALSLSQALMGVKLYAPPPATNQKKGSTPLATCLNDTTTVIASVGGITGCSTVVLGGPDPFAPEKEYRLDSNDTRMQQVMYADGMLFGALDTSLKIHGETKAGIEWFVVEPSIDDGSVRASVENNGYTGLADNNLTYPAIGVNGDGEGVMAFTLAGDDHFPSAAYAKFDENGSGDIHIAAEGKGPADGFSGYKVFGGGGPGVARPRWGDYGAAVPMGNSIWIASEYIGQTCTFAQYISAPFGSCGGTRTSLANWDTRISRVEVG